MESQWDSQMTVDWLDLSSRGRQLGGWLELTALASKLAFVMALKKLEPYLDDAKVSLLGLMMGSLRVFLSGQNK